MLNLNHQNINIVAGRGYQLRSKLVTVVDAGNALGSQIPPYFVFNGQGMVAALMAGKTVGAYAMSTPSRCSDSSVFRTYMKEHFLKFVQGRGTGTIFLNAGHRSHIGLYRIDWAWKNNTVLFVLLLHCSHGWQPMGKGCFGRLQLIHS